MLFVIIIDVYLGNYSRISIIKNGTQCHEKYNKIIYYWSRSMLISFSLDTCSLKDAGSIRKLVVVCRSLVRNHLLILNDFWLLLYTNCGAKSVYNRATLPLVTSSAPILSQLFVLVWWSSTESSVTQQTIFLCFAFSLLFISSSASINWDGFCTRTQWWQRNRIKSTILLNLKCASWLYSRKHIERHSPLDLFSGSVLRTSVLHCCM